LPKLVLNAHALVVICQSSLVDCLIGFPHFPRGNERLPKTHVLIQPLLTLDYLNQLLILTNIYANRNIFLIKNKIFPEIFNKSGKLIKLYEIIHTIIFFLENIDEGEENK
jgi:hypothetical protein